MTKWSGIQLQTYASRELKKNWIRKRFYLFEDFLERRSKFIIIIKYSYNNKFTRCQIFKKLNKNIS